MPSWIELQRDVVRVVLTDDAAAADRVAAAAAGRVRAGLAIHRSTTLESLVRALGEAVPTLRAELGEARFRDLAVDHVRARPPRVPQLLAYGEDLPATMERAGLPAPALALARLDLAWLAAYHAAEAAPLTAADLAGLDPAALAALRPAPHPAARLVAVPPAAHAAWTGAGRLAVRVLDEPGPPGELGPPGGPAPVQAAWAAVLFTRPESEILVARLAPATATLAAGLLAGAGLAEAYQAACRDAGPFDPAPALATLFSRGAFAASLRDEVPP